MKMIGDKGGISGEGAGRALVEENAALRATLDELRERVSELEKLADSDTLTPLPNRRFFVRELERVAAHVTRYGTPAAVLFVDVDGLKTINDAHGHAVGDLALLHVARLLRDSVRAADSVARIGGDEFGLLLDHSDEEAAREKAVALCDAIAADPLPGGIVVAVSIGVAAVRAGDLPEAALARADGDMYAVKRRER